MEAGSGPQGQGGPERKRYLTTLTFAHGEGTLDMETAMTEAREVIGCGERQDLRIIDGRTTVAREREPVEEFNYGSEEVFKNERALAWERGEAWARPSGVAAETGVH